MHYKTKFGKNTESFKNSLLTSPLASLSNALYFRNNYRKKDLITYANMVYQDSGNRLKTARTV